jgi:RimJ/RimL family protein N-acetyltransferase
LIYRLQEGEYGRMRPVFAELRYNLVIDSVIAGNTPAWVYADDARNPQTAWMWNRQDAMLLAGSPDNDIFNRALGELITTQVIPDAKRRCIPQLSLHYTPGTWESKIDLIMKGKAPEKAGRRFYTLERLKVDWRARIPSGFEMARMDQELLENTALQNIQEVVGWVRSFWPSIPDFIETGFGFFLLQDDTVASWCLSVYVSGEHYELGLATAQPHRNRGFATLTAAACIEHCVEHRLTPHWHCWDDNAPSIAVAEKVGFARPMGYTVYRFNVKEQTG